ncbi:MAG: hypothetical protein GWM90_21950, partial [Gemmatimonadetes bacterium]|nr:hypothetical protein [Gemmatimonadota bacterium]NIQ57851.1 hypothetical protein [Gemmatimonadota bacterium]NIU78004.1 hypothetical protein [Gammaproteobacteria bacterium]NIX46646.1 hypothetical protein [Gemmatimonadota bacterium]NIY10988.1 hypothetical protein [Gemmatimonadota bacterium]
MRPGQPVLVALLGAAALTACSDLATSPDRTPTTLRVAPDTARLVEGEAVTFTLEVLDQDGVPYEVLPAWAPPLWTSSRPELLEVDAGGQGVARAPGASWTRVELAGLTARALVRTNPRTMDVAVPFAYITQSVQRRGGGVPLVAGRPGLLRVYVVGSHP